MLAAGSSHLSYYTHGYLRNEVNETNKSQIMREFKPFSGLQIFPASLKKKAQLQEFRSVLKESASTTVLISVLSNDWEKFLTVNHRPFEISPFIIVKWQNSTLRKKLNWNLKEMRLSKINTNLLKSQIERYNTFLNDMLSETNITILYQTSILERIYSNVDSLQLDMLFIVLNNLLKKSLKGLRVRNCNQEQVHLKFISLASQYHHTNWMFIPIHLFRTTKHCDTLIPRVILPGPH